ncbi:MULTISPECIES: acyl-CoA carboxylase subunit beta [unclassified Comamonas]|uniref:acyl-CoA carboxylase subunit beta n=1 Tax=unclassified Comamonas TaxID=2638500 RepID=UPI001FA7287B|nr:MULTISPECIES: carboxyl transferase domain-containing protein [unclassified Comamonas]UNV88540.1 propionyl-CoA carboxylase [Comamonas sp. 7D-2evo1]UNV93557.1 propionyl-CoA carboxylase [Comamonas sp. 7D-2]UNV98183.1 propionyl-CoA carboxylase [Comamonas sp. 7D-2evo2]
MTVPDSSVTWQKERNELQARCSAAQAMGGPTNLARARELGKLNARERIAAFYANDSYRELGMLAGKGKYSPNGELESFTPSNHVLTIGQSQGKRLVLISDDASIRGGSSEAAVAEKWIYADRYAHEYKLPLVRLVETAGGSVKLLEQLGHTKIPGYSLLPSAKLLGEVPVVGVALGACAGLGAIRVGTSHFSVMVQGQSQVFAAGPPVVKRALGMDVGKEELGGYGVHKLSGAVNNVAATELEAFEQVHRFLSYLPENVWQLPPRTDNNDPPGRADAWLNEAIPEDRRKIFKVKELLRCIFDQDSLFELSPGYGASLVTFFARLNGYPVGVISNNPAVMGGALTVAAARKLERFVDLCDTFHLPIVNLMDQPGTMTGVEAERQGTIVAALKASAAIEQSCVPWIGIVIRRCFGLAGGMLTPWVGASGTSLLHRFGWPSARWGSLPIEGGVAAAYKTELAQADDPQEALQQLEAKFHAIGSPLRTAEKFGVVDIIEPAQTRSLLCDWIEDARQLTQLQLGPKSRYMR